MPVTINNRVLIVSGAGGNRKKEYQPSVRRLKYGETRSYLLARLQRDHPDVKVAD